MAKNLIIVESPAKAKTIEKYMGKDFKVLASMGHVRDLPKSAFGIECNGNVLIDYEPIKRKAAQKAVTELRKATKDSELVWLATDPDREGESIAWHVAELLKLKPETRRRVSFTEITKRAVTQAFENPRDIDMNLVDAQQARRAVDRIVGYRLSPLLWRNLAPNLSAGRVQSAALFLIVQRERERRAFVETEYWDVTAQLATKPGEVFSAFYPASQDKENPELGDEASATALVERVRPGPWTVKEIRTSERKQKPPAPFKTSTLQQKASTSLNFPVWKTMKVAQTLYEAGHITYMRTDSINLSNDALGEIGRTVETMYGGDYHQVRKFQGKAKGAQEAHEAIRPAILSNTPEEMAGTLKNSDEVRLYTLIWQRTMASQMAEAVYDQTSVDIESNEAIFRATGKVLKFDGFMRVYLDTRDDAEEQEETEGLLPELSEGDVLDLRELEPAQHFTQPPPRYTEATLVREMEAQGIGRPSTYSPTIKTLEDRNYVEVESRRLSPTLLGEVKTELLEKHFQEIVDLEFTSRMEEDLDEVAEGAKEMAPLVCNFLSSFTAHVDEQKDKMSRPERPTDLTCPECGKPVVEKFGKHGLFFRSCSDWPDCKWSEQLDAEGNVLKIEGTGEKCPDCGSELVAKTGRFGPFVGCSNYPDCKYIKKEPPKETGETCPQCGSPLVEKRGRFGPFTGCSNYPECKFIKKKPRKTTKKKTTKKAPAST